MSSYPEASARPTSSAGRPKILTAAIGVAVLAGLAAVINGVVILAGGLDLVKELAAAEIAKELGISSEEAKAFTSGADGLLGPVLDEKFKEIQSTFQTRAWAALIAGAALLILGLLMRQAAKWTRVLVTICAALVVIFSIIIAGDGPNGLMLTLGTLGFLGGLVAIVLTWLPPIGRYAKAASGS